MVLRAPNGTADDPNPDGLIPVTLFPNSGAGYGFGITDAAKWPEGYDRTINMTVREGRILSPSFATQLRLPTYAAGVFPATTPRIMAGWRTSANVPFVIYSLGTEIKKIENAAQSNETDATTNTYWDAAFHDNGAGTAYLYAATVTSFASPVASLLNRRTQAGVWAQDADVNAKLIVSGAGALWRATSDYQISKCPAGSEPFTIGNWGAAVQIGTNEAKVTALGMIGAAPICGKEDGIYKYIEADNRFENVYRVPLHKDNFPFMAPDGAGGLFTSTVNGDLVNIQQFGAIVVSNPLGEKFPGRDTPTGQIRAVAVDGEDIFAVVQTAAKKVKSTSITVLKTTDDFGTFTDYSIQATDRSFATTIDLSSLDTLANGDAWLIGFDEQFLAAEIIMLATNSNARVTSVWLSFGEGAWAAADVLDGTATGATQITLSRDGVIAIVLATTTLPFWMKATYEGYEKYWWRLSVGAS